MYVDAAVLSGYLFLCLIIFESGQWIERFLVERSRNSAREWARKWAHVLSGVSVAVLPLTGCSKWVGVVLGAIVLMVLVCGKGLFVRRNHLAYLFGREGSPMFALTLIVISYFYFDSPTIFSTTFLILALADTAASVVGQTIGVPRILGKSWAGSVAHFVVACCVLLSMSYWADISIAESMILTFVVAGLATIVEFVSIRGSDNFTVPLSVAMTLSLWLGL